MKHEKTEHQIDRNNRLGSPTQWALAVGAGSVSAASTFINLVRTKFHVDTLSKPEVKQLYEAHGKDLMELTKTQIEQAKSLFGITEKAEDSARVIRDAFKNSDHAIHTLMHQPEHIERSSVYRAAIHDTKTHFDKFLDRFAEAFLGISSTGLKGHTVGVVQRFNTFGNYSRRNIAFKTAAAFGAGAGVVMMIVNQLNTRDKLNELTKTANDNGDRLDTLLEGQQVQLKDQDHSGHMHSKRFTQTLTQPTSHTERFTQGANDHEGSHTARLHAEAETAAITR